MKFNEGITHRRFIKLITCLLFFFFYALLQLSELGRWVGRGAYTSPDGTWSEHTLLRLISGQMHERWETPTWSTATLEGYMFMFLAASSVSINPREEKEDYMLPLRVPFLWKWQGAAHCCGGPCAIRGGWMKWGLNGQGEGRRVMWRTVPASRRGQWFSA